MSPYKSFLKRTLDMLLAAVAAIALAPLIAALALIIAFKLGRPVLFYQERTGWKRRPFHIIKFRSMLDATDEKGQPLSDELRLTRFGHWLRSLSLDELPSLWNIIRGDMSLVGPRPFMHQYNELYSREQARRFEVRPGITGWAQVNGRNAISWPQKFALDVWYVENQSFLLDLRIMLLTVLHLFRRHGINSDDAATMPLFRGETEQASPHDNAGS